MKFAQVFETIGIGCDDKARRVVNVSAQKANITADEIESGVTIERLSTIGVPVLRYQTQVTIHGQIPEFSETARPGGYNSVIRNANGSIGVRYVAIDAEKKKTAVLASCYGNKKYTLHINSTGMEASAHYETKEECLAGLRAFPKDLVCGSVCAAAGVYGGYYVFATIGAIPVANLWPFIEAVTGIKSQDELDSMIRAEEDRRAADRVAREAALSAAADIAEEAKNATAAQMTNRRLTALPAKGFFVRLVASGSVVRKVLVMLDKRGPALCYATTAYTGQKSFVPEGKMNRVESHNRAGYARELAAGRLFEP